MKTFTQLINDILPNITEIFPWDLEDMRAEDPNLLLVDIREQDEFDVAHIKNSLHVPRGILESCCDWNYAETIPALVNARQQPVVVICRSGNRSALAAHTMQMMGYEKVVSLKTGLKGWNDSDLALYNQADDEVDPEATDVFFNPPLDKSQLSP
jgi:rhodanese-related sulfurtransferase